MKKVSYEEVNKYLDVVYGEDDYYCSTNDFEDRATMFDNAVKGIDNFIEQHKPPTWEDVVNSWEGYDNTLELVIEETGNGIIVIERGVVQFLHIDRFGTVTQFGLRNRCLTNNLLKAINLTIRYSENQKEIIDEN